MWNDKVCIDTKDITQIIAIFKRKSKFSIYTSDIEKCVCHDTETEYRKDTLIDERFGYIKSCIGEYKNIEDAIKARVCVEEKYFTPILERYDEHLIANNLEWLYYI